MGEQFGNFRDGIWIENENEFDKEQISRHKSYKNCYLMINVVIIYASVCVGGD